MQVSLKNSSKPIFLGPKSGFATRFPNMHAASVKTKKPMLTPTPTQRGGVYSAFSCTVSGLFGKTDLRKGCQWIVFCDIMACILLSVSSGLCHVEEK